MWSSQWVQKDSAKTKSPSLGAELGFCFGGHERSPMMLDPNIYSGDFSVAASQLVTNCWFQHFSSLLQCLSKQQTRTCHYSHELLTITSLGGDLIEKSLV